ncbi:MAG: hypothetical protein SO434_05270 [Eubacteriales bacterium]|nr:hypothetical protein [Eubacteriales bacterium]
MNKKLLALVLIMVVLASFFVGCTMFETDEYREYHQVVATVNYKAMSAELYRGDVLNYVANYGAAYIQNYGMTVEQVVEYFYNNLSKQKLLLLYAKDYVASNGIGITAVASDEEIAAMASKDFLSVDELRYCIEATNKEFEELWEKKIKDLEDEQAANSDQEEEEEETTDTSEELAARPTRSKTTESDEYVDQGMTDPSQLPAYFYDYVSDKIKSESDATKKSNMKSALNSLKKNLESNFTDYDYFLNQQIETRIIAKYQDAIQKTITISDEEIAARYTKLVDTDINKYIDEDTYASAMSNNTFSMYHTNKGYFNVKSILLKFDDAQSTVLGYIKSIEGEEVAKQYRQKVAFGTLESTDKYYELFKNAEDEKDYTGGIKVNVSNPDYDSEVDELAKAYTDKGIDMNVILYAMADDIANKVDAMMTAASAKGITDPQQLEAIEHYAKVEAFTDWIYLVNDDSGMFSNDSYAVSRDGRATSYVEEYTVLARELYKSGIDATAVAVTGSAFDSKSLTYSGETAILQGANGKIANINSVLATSRVANDEEISTDIYTLTTADGNEISYIINDYGIHIVMVVSAPIEDDASVEEVIEDGNVVGYKNKLDKIYSADVKVTYVKDEEGNDTEEIESFEVEIKTIRDYIQDILLKEGSNDVLTKNQMELFADESKISKNEKVYNKLIDYLNK